jgi:uncharacterized OB-fold protein
VSASEAVPKPLPSTDGPAADYYRHCLNGELRFQRCGDCGAWRHPWARSSGRGRIFSWTVTHQAMHPAFAAEVPYAVIVVEMEEGVRLVTGLRGLDPSELRLDLPVEVEFEKLNDEIAIPHFHPA